MRTTFAVRSLQVASLAALAVAVACSNGGVTLNQEDAATATPGLTVGESCDATHVCRTGLTCNAGKCGACGCVKTGSPCNLNDDCMAGQYCGPNRTCTATTASTSDGGGVNATCRSDADCGSGLRCDLVGFSAQCEPEGKGDVGGMCMLASDCLGGLGCEMGKCTPLPPVGDAATVPLGFPPIWAGETCKDDTGPTAAYFHVPRGTNDGDFYRLPFPNDVRLTSGKVSLSNPNHPTPGKALLGFDVVQRWFDNLQSNVDGFSTYPTVIFRFSAGIDLNSTFSNGALNVFHWIDITTPAMPQDIGFNWYGSTAGNHYVCPNWVGVRPPAGSPLTPGHTYTVFMTTAGLDSMSKAIQVPADLSALLATTTPSDTALAAQWPKYQPLRDWAAAAKFDTKTILNATVFTVGHPTAIGPKLAAAVASAGVPTATGWVNCASGTSPCSQAAGSRACPSTPDSAFDELHALVTLPIFQRGTEPYSSPPDGDFLLASDGTPQMARTEKVCMALTVPKGVTMPAGGWPLVVYAHGTGGSFRSHVTEGVARRLASVDDGAGGHVNIAVLGIDQVETGPRRGTSTDSPDNLFYNFANPGAARGNPLQGAADQLSLFAFVTGFDLPAAQSPTTVEIKVGPVAFWGHSQGATEGGIALPYATGIKGAVLSGEGASLIDALLNKRNPVNIAAAIPVALEDPAPGAVGEYHPVLALFQNDLDLVDPLNHAAALVTNPIATANQRHIFQPYGQGDTYAPPATEQVFAMAAALGKASPPSGVTDDPFGAGMTIPVPAGGNVTVNGATITAIVRQYAPGASYDGHFVSFDNTQAESDVDHFLADTLTGKTPPKVGR
jgi:hypothetical protein